MNDTEQRAYVWLLGQGHTDITFHSSTTPDFVTSTGEKFEVKKVRNNVIWFSPGQLEQLRWQKKTKIIVMDGGDEPVAVFPFSEIKDGYYGNIKVAGSDQVPLRSIRIDDSAWTKAKLDALDHGMTLQEWVTLCLLRGSGSGITELHIAGEGIKR